MTDDDDDLREAFARAHEPWGRFKVSKGYARQVREVSSPDFQNLKASPELREAFARAHEPAPRFVVGVRRRPPVRVGLAVTVAVAMAMAAIVAWPRADEPAVVAPEADVDLTSPALSSTSLAMPLDHLLAVPELAVLGTTPRLVGGVP